MGSPDPWTASDAQRRITAFWDVVCDRYDDEPGNVPAVGSTQATAWSDTVAALLGSPPRDVLDVGTGTGFVANVAAMLGHSVTGIDLSRGMLAVARANAAACGVGVTFREGDAVSPPYPPQSFDVVTNRSLVWTLLDLDRALAAWRALLRDDGRLICIYGLVEAPDGCGLRPSERSRGAFFDEHYPPQTRRLLAGMDLTEHRPLIDAVQRAGFRSPQIQTIDVGGSGAAHHALVATV